MAKIYIDSIKLGSSGTTFRFDNLNLDSLYEYHFVVEPRVSGSVNLFWMANDDLDANNYYRNIWFNRGSVWGGGNSKSRYIEGVSSGYHVRTEVRLVKTQFGCSAVCRSSQKDSNFLTSRGEIQWISNGANLTSFSFILNGNAAAESWADAYSVAHRFEY